MRNRLQLSIQPGQKELARRIALKEIGKKVLNITAITIGAAAVIGNFIACENPQNTSKIPLTPTATVNSGRRFRSSSSRRRRRRRKS